jgi:hypothetical protein
LAVADYLIVAGATKMSWQLDGTRARVRCGDLTAQVDVEYPSHGVCQIRYQDTSFAGAQILGVITSDGKTDRQELPGEYHVRGTDLIALYDEPGGARVTRDIYWRAVSDEETHLCGLELWLSAETQLLDSDPHLFSRSKLPPGDVFQLTGGNTGGFSEIADRPGEQVALTRDESVGVLLIRPARRSWSYCEMVHPADFHRSTMDAIEDGRMELSTSFFVHERLEKGVIRRARVRGLFLPRRDDIAQALVAYRAFAASKLPLTT